MARPRSPGRHDPSSRVLLVSHEASRSGAPRVAVLIARSLVRDRHVVRIVSRTAGPLLDDFRSVAPAFIEPFHRLRRRLRRLPGGDWMAAAADTLVAAGAILGSRADVVYVNSAAAATYVAPARLLRRRVILHFHESSHVASRFLGGDRPVRLDGIRLVACSPSVREEISGLVGRDAMEIALVLSVPDAEEVERRANERADFPYRANELVIGCCGTAEWRKGADLWVQAARRVLEMRPDRRLRFVWVGDLPGTIDIKPEEPIHFIGPRANPYPHMRRFDIATLPSRDDPFPLVVLESMALARPVIAFAVGGVPQQIGAAGILVPPGDVGAFAQSVVSLIDDSAARERLGLAGQQRVWSNFSIEAFATSVARTMREG